MTRARICWTDLLPDDHPPGLDHLLRQMSWPDAVGLVQNALSGLTVYLTAPCEQALRSQFSLGRGELGGLLLGRVFGVTFPAATGYPWVTIVEKALPSLEYHNSSVSLRMGTEVWSRAAAELQRGLVVVGWYHSHPDLGAFFSATDRDTQAAFFNQPYSLGLVMDPVRNERRCFYGGTSEELGPQAVAVL